MGRPSKPDGERIRDIPPTGIRFPPDLRAAIEREANINGRTISGEIVHRLRLSLEGDQRAFVSPAVQLIEVNAPALTDHERMLLGLFKTMPPDKQLALLTVLRR